MASAALFRSIRKFRLQPKCDRNHSLAIFKRVNSIWIRRLCTHYCAAMQTVDHELLIKPKNKIERNPNALIRREQQNSGNSFEKCSSCLNIYWGTVSIEIVAFLCLVGLHSLIPAAWLRCPFTSCIVRSVVDVHKCASHRSCIVQLKRPNTSIDHHRNQNHLIPCPQIMAEHFCFLFNFIEINLPNKSYFGAMTQKCEWFVRDGG